MCVYVAVSSRSSSRTRLLMFRERIVRTKGVGPMRFSKVEFFLLM